jgi:hypothetical protein
VEHSIKVTGKVGIYPFKNSFYGANGLRGLEQQRKAPLLWTHRFWEGILDTSFILHYFVAPEIPVRQKKINEVTKDFNTEHPFQGNVLCCVCKVLHHWHLKHGHQVDCLCSDREALPAIHE